ncbi:MAG TPA: hypothetical protein VHH09_01105 [Acidimicrobiales bacterium]|nr:hypothetical protein [Acidimicrobiales bacterium]
MTRHGRPLAALTAAILLLSGCSGDGDDADRPNRRPSPEAGSRAAPPTTVTNPAYGAIEEALRAGGNLAVCDRRAEAGDASGSYERRIFTLATGACPPEGTSPVTGAVVVNAYDSTIIRDASAEVDFGDRQAAWTYQQFVVSVTDGTPADVVAGVEAAMSTLGAQKTYDERSSPTRGG